MASAEPVTVEVVFAERRRAVRRQVRVPRGSTVREVVVASGILTEIGGTPEAHPVGIFGRRVGLDTSVVDGDRVELYRPLVVDPKQARRRLADARRLRR